VSVVADIDDRPVIVGDVPENVRLPAIVSADNVPMLVIAGWAAVDRAPVSVVADIDDRPVIVGDVTVNDRLPAILFE
jgi:hypothetical protein